MDTHTHTRTFTKLPSHFLLDVRVMPAKKRLVPPIRPNADGTGFTRPGRGPTGPTRVRSPGPQRHKTPTTSTSSSASSAASGASATASSTASRASSAAAAATPSRGQREQPAAARDARRAHLSALAPPGRSSRGAGLDRSASAAVEPPPSSSPHHPTSSTVPSECASTPAGTARVEAASSTVSADAARPPEDAPGKSAAPPKGEAKAPLQAVSSAAGITVSVAVDAALGPSECSVAPRAMHRLGLQCGHLVYLSTTHGALVAEVRAARASATAIDRLLVNSDAAGLLVELSAVALRAVALPARGLPTVRCVTLTLAPPEGARDGLLDEKVGVVPALAATTAWLAAFRRVLHHKIAYTHLRTTQRVLTHRVALEVTTLVLDAEEGDSAAGATGAETMPAWGLVTDATEVRLCARGRVAPVSAAVESDLTGAAAAPPTGFTCTLVVGEAGVGKTRWLTQHAAALSGRHVEWMAVEQLPQGEGSEVGTATALREMLERARHSAPATVLIDDLHLVCAKETSSAGSRWAMSLLSHALAEELLDMQNRSVDVHVVASAPALESLDACLTGAALFGCDVVRLEMPANTEERLRCLRSCLAEQYGTGNAASAGGSVGAAPALSEACLLEVAERAHGFTQRDVHRLVETSVVRAFQSRQSTHVTDADLRAAAAVVHPSLLKRFEVCVPNVAWADIGGSAAAKQTLCDVVEWCLGKQRWIFTEFNLTPPKGVLLYGPPGCSKTMLAKALANESHMNFISVKGPEVFSKWVGDSEKAVRDIFERARAASPCVVFIDELDGMCGHRGRGGVSDRVISQFLTELDGLPAAFDEKKNALVFVAATNRPDSIDGAVLRPGRIDRRVYVGLPTLPERAAIAEIQFKRLPIAPELTTAYVAERTEGYTGAEVVAVVKEAAFHAITADARAACVTLADVDVALLKVRPRISAADVEWYRHWPHNSKATAAS